MSTIFGVRLPGNFFELLKKYQILGAMRQMEHMRHIKRIDELYQCMDIMQRGKPDHDDKIHLRIEQNRPGMVEHADYNTETKCFYGGWHMFFTNDKKKVTCPICQGKF